MTSKPKPQPKSSRHGLFGNMARNSADAVNASGNGNSNSNAFDVEPKTDATIPPHQEHRLPFHRSGTRPTQWIKPEGESYRSGIDPLHFLAICFRSSSRVAMAVNVLWPVVPAAIAVHFARPDWHLAIFILNYIAMVPAANLIGFAGQELARKLPKVIGVVLETTLGSVVEIILFIVLISKASGEQAPTYFNIIKAAILGSILANLLLCLGVCFFAGGLLREEQKFHEAVSEVGSGLMLVAGMALVIPAAFAATFRGTDLTVYDDLTEASLDDRIVKISRACAVMLLCSFFVYVFFQIRSHHGLYDEIFENDELHDHDRERDLKKAKLTLTECVLALVIALVCVSLIAVFLVQQIEWLVDNRHVPDAFIGLILVPLVEKAAEHLTAVDEAWDNQMNFALSHVLGATIQTALFNTPIVMIVAWGLDRNLDLNFQTFDSVILILAIAVVGNFLRDGKSNYLEGFLCVIVYIIIAVSAWYYPNPRKEEGTAEVETGESGGEASGEVAARAIQILARASGIPI